MTSEIVCCAEESLLLFQIIADGLGYFLYDVLDLYPMDPLARFLRFTLLNGIKSSLIIAVMIYVVGVVRAGIRPKTAQLFLHGRSKWFGYFAGALFGIITPFCSCAAVPIFIAFTTTGISIGVAIAFLIASPLVTEAGVVLSLESLGVSFTILTIVIAILVAVFGGILFDYLVSRNFPLLEISNTDDVEELSSIEIKSFRDRHRYGIQELRKIGGKVAPWLALSIVIAGLFQLYLTPSVVEKYLSSGTWFSVPLAVLVGIPLYGTAGAIIPILSVLSEKGASVGTIVAFMLSVNGASIPAFVLLKSIFSRYGLVLMFLYFVVSFVVVGITVDLILS